MRNRLTDDIVFFTSSQMVGAWGWPVISLNSPVGRNYTGQVLFHTIHTREFKPRQAHLNVDEDKDPLSSPFLR